MSNDFDIAGHQVTHLTINHRHLLKYLEPFRDFVSTSKPDGLFFWHGMVHAPQLLYAVRDLPIPKVLYGGNPVYDIHVHWQYEVYSWLLPVNVSSTTFACCSDFVSKSFDTSPYLKKFPRTTIYNGVNEPEINLLHHPRPLSSHDDVTIGMVARLDPIKDHKTVILAFKELLKTWPKARLELAGDGKLRSELETLANNQGISDQITFLGTVVDVYSALSKWDLFAYASTQREGLGSAVAEAMLLGLPVVATDVGPIGEFSGNTNSIQLVPGGDPLILAQCVGQLLSDHAGRLRLSQAARKRAQSEYGADICAKRYAKLVGLDLE